MLGIENVFFSIWMFLPMFKLFKGYMSLLYLCLHNS
jgi:hypothetical protein